MLARMWGKGNSIHCWWECKLVQLLWKTVWMFLKKLKIELPYDKEIPLLGIYMKKTKTLIRKDICTPISIAVLFTIAKIWKQPKSPWMDEEDVIHTSARTHAHTHTHTHTLEYYSAIKKNEILPFATTWMDFEGIILSEVSDREGQILYDITYIWNPKNTAN